MCKPILGQDTYLNLYPKNVSESTPPQPGLPQPPFEAELRVLVEVTGADEPDQIRIVFDKEYFLINNKDGSDQNPVLITNKALGAKREAGTIKIECVCGFNTPQEILVYAYPKNSLQQNSGQQMSLRKLAGKIIVMPNLNPKKLKMVLVRVQTNINTNNQLDSKIGEFNSESFSNETTGLVNGLHQALIHTEIIEKVTDETENLQDIVLNVSNDYRFKINRDSNEIAVDSDFISALGKIKKHRNILPVLKTLFNTQTANKFANDLLVFSFDEEVPIQGNMLINGWAEGIGEKSVVIFKTRNNQTLTHEAMHALGLYHTHIDNTIESSNQQFVFYNANIDPTLATDNIMSYNGELRKSTWQWQWEILNTKI